MHCFRPHGHLTHDASWLKKMRTIQQARQLHEHHTPTGRRVNLKGARWPLSSLAAQPMLLAPPSSGVPSFFRAAATCEKLRSPACQCGGALSFLAASYGGPAMTSWVLAHPLQRPRLLGFSK